MENMAKTKDGFWEERMGTFSSFPRDRQFYRTLVFILEPMCLFLTRSLWMMKTDHTSKVRVQQIHSSPSNPVGDSKKRNAFLLLRPNATVFHLMIFSSVPSLYLTFLDQSSFRTLFCSPIPLLIATQLNFLDDFYNTSRQDWQGQTPSHT